jgi:hypothetical protein
MILAPNTAFLHRMIAAFLPVHLAALLPGNWGRHHLLMPQLPPLVISDAQSTLLHSVDHLCMRSSPALHIAALLPGIWGRHHLLTPQMPPLSSLTPRVSLLHSVDHLCGRSSPASHIAALLPGIWGRHHPFDAPNATLCHL